MEFGLLTSLSTEDGEYGRSSSSSLLTQSPAAFSRRSEAQRVGQGLIRLFARCGLSEQPTRHLILLSNHTRTDCFQAAKDCQQTTR
jgi:hypothetical protein